MMKNNSERRYRGHGLVGTIIFHVILILLMIYGKMTATKESEEALLVNYAYDEGGGAGNEGAEPAPAEATNEAEEEPAPAEPTPAEPQPAEQEAVKADGESTSTQDFEEAAALAEAKKKAEAEAKARRDAEIKAREEAAAKAKAEAEAKAKAEAEAKAKAAAEAKAKAEAEAKAKAEAEAKARAEARAKAQAEARAKASSAIGRGLGNTNGTGTSGDGTGSSGQGGATSGGMGNGVGNGSGNGGGNSFSLAGRSLVGSLPVPTVNVQTPGKVVVEITVDKSGKVVSAHVTPKGTTIQHAPTWRADEQAALKAKFNADPSKPATQTGTITYNHKVN